MKNLNQGTWSGNLVKDTETAMTPNEHWTTKGSIAINKWYAKGQEPTDEQKKKDTVFISFQGWGKHEGKKGDYCYLIDSKLSQWVNKEGQRVTMIDAGEIVIKAKESANSTTILDEVKKRQQQDEDTPIFDDDIPFK